MKISTKLTKFMIGILSPAIASIIGSLFIIQYQQPQIVYYSDGSYSKINDLLIGSIFIVNEGRSSENNLSVLINEELLPADISVDYLSTGVEIIPDNNKVRITIPKLKPHEYAEIVFRSRMTNEYFDIESITSDSGNITHEEWVKKSWLSFTKLQLGIIWILMAFVFAVGFWIGSIKESARRRSKKDALIS